MGDGSPVLFAHGFSMSHQDWIENSYTATLSQKYKLILVDGRGHGKSDKPYDPEQYKTYLLSNDHIAVLDELGIESAHFVGYSMGGATCFATALYHPSRCRSLTLLGFQPFNPKDLSHLEPEREPRPVEGLPDSPNPIMTLVEGGANAWVQFWEANVDTSPDTIERLRANDFKALAAYRLIPDDFKDNIEQKLPGLGLHCQFLAGEKDTVVLGAREATKIMPNCNFVLLPGMNHFETFYQTETTIPIIQAFLVR
ncbi:MAG: alpha/beta hydrolase [Anaerolineales bacterium]|jgi:pimeloyl-ACP methyl ester carboxylesterase